MKEISKMRGKSVLLTVVIVAGTLALSSCSGGSSYRLTENYSEGVYETRDGEYTVLVTPTNGAYIDPFMELINRYFKTPEEVVLLGHSEIVSGMPLFGTTTTLKSARYYIRGEGFTAVVSVDLKGNHGKWKVVDYNVDYIEYDPEKMRPE
jgi:hypothetical protein